MAPLAFGFLSVQSGDAFHRQGEDALTAKIQELINKINEEGLYQQWVDQITLAK